MFSVATNLRASRGMTISSLAIGNLGIMERFIRSGLRVPDFYKSGDSATIAYKRFCNLRCFMPLRWCTSLKFEETSTTLEKLSSGRPRWSRTVENMESVNKSFRDNQSLSIRKSANALNGHRSWFHRIFHKYSVSFLKSKHKNNLVYPQLTRNPIYESITFL